jgi:glycerophosphoryl diester phosphodiesterase
MEASRAQRLPFPIRIIVTTPPSHPVTQRIRADDRIRPLVASHRGDSHNHPENTLSAFRRATELGVAIQEFDVRELASGELVCIHDETFERTSDAGNKLQPGTLVRDTDFATARSLDVGSWHENGQLGEKIPTLSEALAVMLPDCIPLIEHKSGTAVRYVDFLRDGAFTDSVILQSFDWHFLAEVHRLAPEIAIGALGPNPEHANPEAAAIDAAISFGADLLHWRAADLTRADVARAHDRGLLICTYTTDDLAGWLAGQSIGVDAMCSNDPGTMDQALRSSPNDGVT